MGRRSTALFAAILMALSAVWPAAAAASGPDVSAYWCGPFAPSAKAQAASEALLEAVGESPEPEIPATPDCAACCVLGACTVAARVDVVLARLDPPSGRVEAPRVIAAPDAARGPPLGGRAPPAA
jgi:hypothetical protein